ncbi:GNAT family N-acetyltransferase, partial [Candidatus Gracilibacteria bacterium]|nr:GNAT family N-acetyltransferase [Candidatus Gracilibacteria bacterium]
KKKDFAIVRELHTFGAEMGISKGAGNSQHRGFGKKLVREAEKLAKKNEFKKLKIIAGIGVQEYYRKLGYTLDREKIYMEKFLGNSSNLKSRSGKYRTANTENLSGSFWN